MLKRRSTWFFVLGMLVVLLGACSSDGGKNDGSDVIATVNGEEITKKEYDSEFETLKASYAQQGINFDDLDEEKMEDMENALLDQLINSKLVMQTSKEEGISVEQSKVNTEFEKVKAEFENDQKFEEALKELNLTEDKLKEQVKEELIVQEYLDRKIGKLTVTDEDVQALYDQYKQQAESQEQKPEDFETIKPQLEQQATVQKRNEKMTEVIEKLRKINEDNIEVLL